MISMQKKQNKQKTSRKKTGIKKSNIILSVVAVVIIAIAASTTLFSKNNDEINTEQPKATTVSSTNENGDLVIPIADITEKATFYAYDELDTKMEILAVKAPDGTIRTAFNTCQVCYSSGRGYYVQEGDALVCQNCGNVFQMDQVEITKGGCNPVPISQGGKEVTDTSITISKDFLTQAEVIFANWKI